MLEAVQAEAPPATIGPYRVLAKIGEGGMGVIYRGQHAITGELVAVKTVRVPDVRYLAGIRREIHGLSRLRHPGVVRIVAEGAEGGLPWYAMELLRGRTLEEKLQTSWSSSIHPSYDSDLPTRQATAAPLKRSTQVGSAAYWALADVPPPLPSERVVAGAGNLTTILTLVRRLCETLAFLHGEGVVHRDLKPANVFVREDGHPVVVDFGLMWRFPGAAGREVLDVSVHAGTPAYMAPEQVYGELVDARTDLYAVGCVLFEAVTGRLPFGSGIAMLSAKLTTLPPPPSELAEGVPQALDDLILRLLEPRPRDRIGHAGDVANALRALVNDGPASLEPQPATRAYVYRPELVGRDDTLHRLTSYLDEAQGGDGGCVLLRGESGIGKTYLSMAFAHTAEARGLHVVTGSCAPGATAERSGLDHVADRRDVVEPQTTPNDAPLHPFSSFLHTVADRCLERGAETMARLLGPRAKVLASCEPSLARLPGQDAYPDPPELPAQAARERLLRSLAETLAAFASELPLLLILDDLQWADELTLELLASLPDGYFHGLPLLVLGTYRAEETTALLERICDKSYVRGVDLGRLDERSVVALVGDMLALPAPPEALTRFVAQRAEGNPFFVAEYVRTAVAEGLLFRGAAGRWQIAHDHGADVYDRLPLPGSLWDLVGRRLGGLGAGARELVALASVIGREIDGELIARVANMAEYAVMEGMRELTTRQVLDEVAADSFRFLHDKLREIAYEGIPAAHRRQLHLAVARALEARHEGTDAFPLFYARLAHHFTKAGQASKAIHYLELAGAQALQNFANQEAVGFFGDLLELASKGGPETPASATPEERLRWARWERQLTDAHFGLGDLASVLEHATRALAWTGHAPPSSNGGWIKSLLVNIPVQVAHRLAPRAFVAPASERELLREAAAAMQKLSHRFYFLDALAMLGGSLWSVNLAERAGGDVKVASPYGMLGVTAGIGRLPGLARRYFELARYSAAETNDPLGLVQSLYAEATWHSGEGAWDRARAVLAEALEVAARTGERNEAEIVATVTANADYFTGRFVESKHAFEVIAANARACANQQHLAWGLYGAARAMIPLGELDGAFARAEEARRVLEPQVELPSKIICLGLLADIQRRRGDLDAAVTLADQTTARIRENNLRAYASITGYVAAAEVYLARCEASLPLGRGHANDAERTARRALKDLLNVSLMIPIGRPSYHRLHGRLLWLAGDEARAKVAWNTAVSSSRERVVPYEEALARVELARLLPKGSAPRSEHLHRAEALFVSMRCPDDLVVVRSLRR